MQKCTRSDVGYVYQWKRFQLSTIIFKEKIIKEKSVDLFAKVVSNWKYNLLTNSYFPLFKSWMRVKSLLYISLLFFNWWSFSLEEIREVRCKGSNNEQNTEIRCFSFQYIQKIVRYRKGLLPSYAIIISLHISTMPRLSHRNRMMNTSDFLECH